MNRVIMMKLKDKVHEIYSSCSALLYSILDGISEEELNWKPAPESRSIKEMFGHLVRVDNSFLKKLSVEPEADDPGNKSAGEILSALKRQHNQFEQIINDSGTMDSSSELILHAAQHYLYHITQMIYLRRAIDRNWISPIEEWERITYKIAEFILDKNK